MCVRMFEPRDDTSLGSLTVSIGVETVEGSAGILCRDAGTINTVYCISV